MLAPQEFTAGPVSAATAKLTLVLPRGSTYEATILITNASGTPTAIFLDGNFRFSSFAAAGNTSWNGVLVPNVSLEVDEISIVDPAKGRPTGSLIRKQSQLAIVARDQPNGWPSARSADYGVAPMSRE